MSSYSSLLYKRGFLFTDIKNPVFSDRDSQAVFKKWRSLNIGECKLYHDPVLLTGAAHTNDHMLVILGMVLNPFDGSFQSNSIAEKLLTLKSKDEYRFREYLSQLSGRFVMILRQGKNFEIYNDACATRTVFYDKSDSHIIVSSHASLIANLMNYSISSDAGYLFYNEKYRNSPMKRLPGIMSPYGQVNILTPNTRLKIPERIIERFFPCMENPGCENYSELEEEVASLMTAQVKLLMKKTKLAMSLTAGADSRVSLAASRPVSKDIEYFTYLSKHKIHIEDVKTAIEICSHFHLSHRIYQWENYFYHGMNEFEAIWKKNLGIERGVLWLDKILADAFPKDRIHIRSNLAEIVRADAHFYQFHSLSDKQLAHMYSPTEMNKDDKAIEKFAEFIQVADFNEKSLLNYDYRDMYEWEYIFPQWLGWMLLESDMSHDTFFLYNNRAILSKMLSLPGEDRANRKILFGVIGRLWPELLDFPFNGKRYDEH